MKTQRFFAAIMSVIMTFTLCITVFPETVSALGTTVRIAGAELTDGYWKTNSNNNGIEPGNADNYSVYFNSSKNTLTLKDLMLLHSTAKTPDSQYNYAIWADGSIIIKLDSHNIISCSDTDNNSAALYVNGDLTVTGGGDLAASGGNAIYCSYGIYASGNISVAESDLYGNGGTANAVANEPACSYGIYSGKNIYTEGQIAGFGGQASSYGAPATSCGIAAEGKISFAGYDYSSALGGYTTAENSTAKSIGIRAGGDLETSGSSKQILCISSEVVGRMAFSYGLDIGGALKICNGCEFRVSSGKATYNCNYGSSNSYGINCAGLTVDAGGALYTAGGEATKDAAITECGSYSCASYGVNSNNNDITVRGIFHAIAGVSNTVDNVPGVAEYVISVGIGIGSASLIIDGGDVYAYAEVGSHPNATSIGAVAGGMQNSGNGIIMRGDSTLIAIAMPNTVNPDAPIFDNNHAAKMMKTSDGLNGLLTESTAVWRGSDNEPYKPIAEGYDDTLNIGKLYVLNDGYGLTLSTQGCDFGTKNAGYTQSELPAIKTVTVTNTGNDYVSLNQPEAANYTIGTLSKTMLNRGESATFTIQPKAGLTYGNRNEVINVTSVNGLLAKVNAVFAVTDATLPTITDVSYNNNGVYTSLSSVSGLLHLKQTTNIKLSATDAESGVKEFSYSLDGTHYTTVTADENGEATFNIEPQFMGSIRVKAIDNAGNESDTFLSQAFTVDSVLPVAEIVPMSSQATSYTLLSDFSSKVIPLYNTDVVLKVNASDTPGNESAFSGIKQVAYTVYHVDTDGTYYNYDSGILYDFTQTEDSSLSAIVPRIDDNSIGLTVPKECDGTGIAFIRLIVRVTDNAGNKGNAYYDFTIDNSAPTIANVAGNTNELTDCVTLSVTATDGLSGIKEYSFDNGQTWQTSNEKVFTENCTVLVRVKDNADLISEASTYEITNIDETAPVISGVNNGETYEGATTFSFSDNNLSSVTVNGQPIDITSGSYTITTDVGENIIIATDAVGHKTEIKIVVNNHVWGKPEEHAATFFECAYLQTTCTLCGKTIRAVHPDTEIYKEVFKDMPFLLDVFSMISSLITLVSHFTDN